MSTRSVVGRSGELAGVRRFLADVPGGRAALIIAGEPGIGKTTIWREGVALARRSGWPVLVARPAENERELTLSGLADLLGGVLGGVAGELPPPQRRALEVALLQRDDDGPPLDDRVLAAAARSAVRALTCRGPTLLAVDDVQWLDPASARIVEYLVRRRGTEPLGLLVAVRSGHETPWPLGLDPAPAGGPGATLLRLGPVPPADLRRLVLRSAGLDLPRSTLLRIHETVGGNPLFALEVARALDRAGASLVPGEPPPLPDSLRELVGARVRALPPPVQEALLHVALLAHPTVETVRAALGAGPEELSALTPAEEAGFVELTGDRIRFTHPILASAVCAVASRERRQRAHRRLAVVAPDVEQRARHLALAGDGADREVAALLEHGARQARRRGSPAAAAELWELARGRTPAQDAPDAHRRAVAAADCLFAAGDTARARALLEATLPEIAGPARARLRLRLAEIEFYDGCTVHAAGMCLAALAEAGGDPVLQAEAHLRRAWFATHDAATQYVSSQAAADLLRPRATEAGPELVACALAVAAMYRLTNGRGIAGDDLRSARRLLAAGAPGHWAARWTRAALGAWAKCFDPLDARSWFEGEYRRAVEHGDEPETGHALMHLAEIDCWLGDWARAGDEAARASEVVELTGQRRWVGFVRYARALVLAHVGEAEAARQAAHDGLALADEAEDPYVAVLHLQVLGFLDLSGGDPAAADRHLTRAAALVARMGIADPVRYTFHGDQIEAAAAAGDVRRARGLLAALRARAAAAPRPWLLATAARCDAVVLAAESELAGAERAAERAVAAAARLPLPLERGRALLVYGKVQRARKHKRRAREALIGAAEVFDGLGARLWARQAAAELARCGLRQTRDGRLTPTEEKVVALVTAGLTNQEVAARMFISTKTVEANLTRVYRKLGVANRRELARLAADGQPG